MFWSQTIIATADLTAVPQFIAVSVAGAVAADSVNAAGILQKGVKSGEHATAYYAGESECRVGAAVVKGARLAVTASGYIITVTSGGYSVGRALAACASGGITRALFNFVSPTFVGSW